MPIQVKKKQDRQDAYPTPRMTGKDAYPTLRMTGRMPIPREEAFGRVMPPDVFSISNPFPVFVRIAACG
jgi:hypothetical protein